MPVVSRPLAGRPSRLRLCSELRRYQHLAPRDSCSRAPAPSLPRAFISSTRGEWFPEFSPDGHRLAFASDRSGEGAIWVADPDGSNPVELAPMGAFATGGPRWSPDGQRIVFPLESARAGGHLCHRRRGRQASKSHLLTRPTIRSRASRETASGSTSAPIAMQERADMEDPGRRRGCRADPEQRRMRAVESPDGAYIYSVETLEKPSPLWRQPVSGGVPVKVLEGVVLSNFVVREQGIYYIDRPSSPDGVYFPRQAFGPGRGFSISTSRPAGRRRWPPSSGMWATSSPSRPMGARSSTFEWTHRLTT